MKILYEKFCFLNSCKELEMTDEGAKKIFEGYGFKYIDD